jgi:hypothetical protein
MVRLTLCRLFWLPRQDRLSGFQHGLFSDAAVLDACGGPPQYHAMRMPIPVWLRKTSLFSIFFLLAAYDVSAEWVHDNGSLGWRDKTNLLWKFNFNSAWGKPFFHPLAVAGGPALTNFKPEDHPWHYGFWFSWKYINHVNYWEEDRATGRAEGLTRWVPPRIDNQKDGSASIRLELTYVNPSNHVDLTEQRLLQISAPGADGSYRIEWRARFTAGDQGAILDRTPMPGEPDGKVNGGYAGLGLRLTGLPFALSMVCSTGEVSRFEEDRARPSAPAVGCNFTLNSKDVGAIAIFSDPANSGEDAPWYLINSDKMRFACAAILTPKVKVLQPGEKMELHYLITLRKQHWTPEALRNSQAEWLRQK